MEKFKFFALWLSLICILIFIIQNLIQNFTSFFILNQNITQIWRFVTAIFLHGSTGHLLYNIFALALFGSILEKLIGSKKFLIVFFTAGILANIIAVNFYSSSLGASGAIFGILGALIIIRPLMMIWTYGIPMPMFVAGILWILGDLVGLFYLTDNIGHIAHLSGIAIGLIFGIICRKPIPKKPRRIILDELTMRNWEDNFIK